MGNYGGLCSAELNQLRMQILISVLPWLTPVLYKGGLQTLAPRLLCLAEVVKPLCCCSSPYRLREHTLLWHIGDGSGDSCPRHPAVKDLYGKGGRNGTAVASGEKQTSKAARFFSECTSK